MSSVKLSLKEQVEILKSSEYWHQFLVGVGEHGPTEIAYGNVIGIMYWADTIEGYDFWSSIDEDHFNFGHDYIDKHERNNIFNKLKTEYPEYFV